MKPMLLIFDTQQLLYRSLHTLNRKQDLDNSIVFGTLTQLKSITERFQPNNLILCWDSKTSKRKAYYPEYKANRKSDIDLTDLFEQKDKLQDIFKIMDWNQIEWDGLESDDIVANAVQQYEGKKIIVSSDQDFYQLLSPDTSMYNPNTKKEFTYKHFRSKYGIDPDKWVFVKAIAGCSGDNVKGVQGIGEKRALDYLKRGDDSKFKEKIDSEFELWKKNLILVELPMLKKQMPELKPLKFNKDMMIDICQIFGFKSIIGNLNKWKEVFEKPIK